MSNGIRNTTFICYFLRGSLGRTILVALSLTPFSFSNPLVSTLLVLVPNLTTVLLYGYSGTSPTMIPLATHGSGRISS